MYTEISTYIQIRVNIIFPLFYCDVKVVPRQQVLTGTTPINQPFENSFHTL